MSSQSVSTPSDLDVFARVQNGVIIEVPVYRMHIRNRAHPAAWYYPVLNANQVDEVPFHRVAVDYVITGDVVTATYSSVPLTLPELLNQVYRTQDIGTTGTGVLFSQVDPELAQHIWKLASEYAEQKLIDFVATKNYTSLDSVFRYRNSTVAAFRQDAERVQFLLDSLWTNLVGYYEQIVSETLPVPRSLEEIESHIPAFAWA